MMEEETRVSVPVDGGEPNQSSYWLDACEDISCDLIDHFVDFDTSIPQDSVDNTSNQDGLTNDFFGGIDHILDSIKNGGGLPTNDDRCLNNNGFQDSTIREGWSLNESSVDGKNQGEGLVLQYNTVSDKDILERNGKMEDFDKGSNNLVNGKGENRLLDHCIQENGLHRNNVKNSGHEALKGRDFDSEDRFSRRARVSCYRNERQYSNRGQYCSRDRERGSNRKRPRDWEDVDRRDRDHMRRREHYNGTSRRDGRDRDWRDKESRGYWERDRSGSNEVVFRLGTWEADNSNKGGKEANGINQECNGKVEKKSDAKDKIPEEKVRKYQLDVLEQAKKKNTIAFLETGAGKTLIAVLLIKSICNELQRQNKKMLAVFLVPKVPLVYQVVHIYFWSVT